MNKCPECRMTNLNLIDSHEDVVFSYPESEDFLSGWREYECPDCNYLFDVKDGIITAIKVIGINNYKTMYKLTEHWESVLLDLNAI